MRAPQEVTYRRFRVVNRLAAWGVFVIALVTYLLTVDPTVSYWDCPEYVTVADKMQIGHSPGNPMWMLAARFVMNFAPDNAHKALAVNISSGIFTALAAMVLYATIVLLALYGRYGSRRRLARVGQLPLPYVVTTLSAGAVGALSFAWLDSVWFSAVEAEVYAFSIFMTALSLYIAFYWAYAAYGEPHADRWLILCAYLIGVGMGVHELNLLCLPAIALVVWHRLRKRQGAWASWLALAVGCAGVVVILFFLIPGFLRFSQALELWTVNRMHLPFNSGFIAAWLCVFAGLLAASLLFTMLRNAKPLIRILRLTFWCGLMLFIGFSCYALIVIRGAANPPLNTTAPGNPFSFSSYYAREQYGSSPLFRGYAFGAPKLLEETVSASGHKSYSRYHSVSPRLRYVKGKKGDKALLRSYFATLADSLQAAADARRSDDFYIMTDYAFDVERVPEMKMWFPRMYSNSPDDIAGYYNWSGMSRDDMVKITSPTLVVDRSGKPVRDASVKKDTLYRPTYLHNLNYLLAYQMGFMYFRYFAWNFVGRQNDNIGHGEPDAGLPATGIAPLDGLWSDPEGLIPPDNGSRNPGRNIYWFLPLLLGLAGCWWQSRRKDCNGRNAAVVLALFFFTGLAIVFYLNQPPTQARDRDYAFLGSYYAFCIWMGFGVMAVSLLVRKLMRHKSELTVAAVASAISLIVPLQILSQTFDDHDRSGRSSVPDMAYNILAPLPQNAILLVDGDNSTFPVWYMQATEELRRDVRIVNLTYLSNADYAAGLLRPEWEAKGLPLLIPESHLRMGRFAYVFLPSDSTWRDAREVLSNLYETQSAERSPRLMTSRVYIPYGPDTLRIDLRKNINSSSTVHQNTIMLLDIISSAAASEPATPVYMVRADGDGVFNGQLLPYMRFEGPVMRLAPGNTLPSDEKVLSDALKLYRWGGADRHPSPYYDPLTDRQMSRMRRDLIYHAVSLSRDSLKGSEALRLIDLLRRKMPPEALPYRAYMQPDSLYSDEGTDLALALWNASHASPNPGATRREALHMIQESYGKALQWDKYRRSLPEVWRQFISDRNALYADELPRLLHLRDSLQSVFDK